jgi:hypothetical protein
LVLLVIGFVNIRRRMRGHRPGPGISRRAAIATATSDAHRHHDVFVAVAPGTNERARVGVAEAPPRGPSPCSATSQIVDVEADVERVALVAI